MRSVAILIATLGVACTQSAPPTPATTTTPVPAESIQPTAPSTPAVSAAPTTAPVGFRLEATVTEQCGSEGGCAYYAELDGPSGPWRAKFATGPEGSGLVIDEGLPATLSLGDYTVTLSSYWVSDVTLNNEPPQESLDATCSADFSVMPGQTAIVARGTFGADECSVDAS